MAYSVTLFSPRAPALPSARLVTMMVLGRKLWQHTEEPVRCPQGSERLRYQNPPARVSYFLEEGRFPASQTGCDVEQFLTDLSLPHKTKWSLSQIWRAPALRPVPPIAAVLSRTASRCLQVIHNEFLSALDR